MGRFRSVSKMQTTTGKKLDLYGVSRQLEKQLEKLDECEILDENREVIKTFLSEFVAGFKPATKMSYIIYLSRFAFEFGETPFREANKPFILEIVKGVEEGKSIIYDHDKHTWKRGEKEYSDHTIASIKDKLKTFFRWLEYYHHTPTEERLIGEDVRKHLKKKPYPDMVAELYSTSPPPKKYSAQDMLTWEEIVRLSQTTESRRNKAAIQLLGESGMRPGEMLSLDVGSIEFRRENGSTIGIIHIQESKTCDYDGIRSIGVVNSVPALQEYLKTHHWVGEKDAPLFLKCRSRTQYLRTRMSSDSFRRVLERAFQIAQINKPHQPKHFRKSRASGLGHILTEQQIKKYMGWTQDSPMLRVYSFVDGEKVNAEYWRSQGVRLEPNGEPQTQEIKPVVCSNCGYTNPVGEQLCIQCHIPLQNEPPELPELKGMLQEMVKEMFLQFQKNEGFSRA